MRKIVYETTKHMSQTFQLIKRVVMFDKNKEIEFEYIKRQDVALVIPINTKRDVILIEQYRASLDDSILEFPGGKKNIGESINDTAQRELKEETGFTAQSLELIGTFYTAPHFTDEKIFVFLAKIANQEEQELEDKEIITLRPITLDTLLELYNSNKLFDAKTQIAVNLLIKTLI